MPRISLLLAAVAVGAISAGALVACGSNDGTIPEANADSMLAALQAASDAEASDDCEAIQEAATAVSDEAAGLTTSDAETREAITAGAENLFKLAGPDGVCEDTTQSQKTTTKDKTTSTQSTTSTTDTSTTTTTEPTTIPEQPPNEGGGNLGEGDSGGTPPNTGSGGTSG